MPVVKGRIAEGGRILVPAAYRKALGLARGDTILIELRGEELRIRPARSALRRLQDKLKTYAAADGLVSEELIAERRAEAARE
jgi:AbrB family looped-hinge helix DNA binding protein